MAITAAAPGHPYQERFPGCVPSLWLHRTGHAWVQRLSLAWFCSEESCSERDQWMTSGWPGG
jgi:hypothetical protein